MLRHFINLSIRAKVLSVPGALVLLLLGLASYAFVLLANNEEKVRDLNNGIVQHAAALVEFETDSLRSMSTLYRLTSTAANETDEEKLNKMGKAVLEGLDRIAAKFPTVKAAVIGAGVPQEKADALDAAFVAYVKAAKFAADMATSDASAALTFMTGAERKFQDVDKLLDETGAVLSARRDGTLASIYAGME